MSDEQKNNQQKGSHGEQKPTSPPKLNIPKADPNVMIKSITPESITIRKSSTSEE